jgi:hypothetical protein
MRGDRNHARSITNSPDLGQLETLLESEKYAFPVDQEYRGRQERSVTSEPYRDIAGASDGETKVRYRERSPSVERHVLDDIRWMGLRIVSLLGNRVFSW